MLDVHDMTEYLPSDVPVNEFANTEIKRVITYIQQHLATVITGDEDYEIFLKGNPAALIEKHEIEITWETDTEAFDAQIKELIIQAGEE